MGSVKERLEMQGCLALVIGGLVFSYSVNYFKFDITRDLSLGWLITALVALVMVIFGLVQIYRGFRLGDK